MIELDELTGLVGDLVELARGAEPSPLHDEVRLHQVVDAVVRRTERRAKRRVFRVAIAPTLVDGDAPRIDRAVANLLDNALKWSPPGSIVDVILRAGVLTVRDRGAGFAAADLPNVFTRFYRADGAPRKAGLRARAGPPAHGPATRQPGSASVCGWGARAVRAGCVRSVSKPCSVSRSVAGVVARSQDVLEGS